jgi:hypothetical protein
VLTLRNFAFVLGRDISFGTAKGCRLDGRAKGLFSTASRPALEPSGKAVGA